MFNTAKKVSIVGVIALAFSLEAQAEKVDFIARHIYEITHEYCQDSALSVDQIESTPIYAFYLALFASAPSIYEKGLDAARSTATAENCNDTSSWIKSISLLLTKK